MVSKGIRKLIVSLQKKKIREDERKYIIEGDKIVKEFLNAGVPVTLLVAKSEFINQIDRSLLNNVKDTVPASYEELKSISTLKTPHNALAIVEMEEPSSNIEPTKGEFSLLLDCIQDPGNLGTIIRAAAWFGIKRIYCSPDSVDIYNPKVIQATMGAILRVKAIYTPLVPFVESAIQMEIPVYGTMLEGESIYELADLLPGLLVFGNESKGISDELKTLITKKITIPRFSQAAPGVESLNVGMAASIVISDFMRRRLT